LEEYIDFDEVIHEFAVRRAKKEKTWLEHLVHKTVLKC